MRAPGTPAEPCRPAQWYRSCHGRWQLPPCWLSRSQQRTSVTVASRSSQACQPVHLPTQSTFWSSCMSIVIEQYCCSNVVPSQHSVELAQDAQHNWCGCNCRAGLRNFRFFPLDAAVCFLCMRRQGQVTRDSDRGDRNPCLILLYNNQFLQPVHANRQVHAAWTRSRHDRLSQLSTLMQVGTARSMHSVHSLVPCARVAMMLCLGAP